MRKYKVEVRTADRHLLCGMEYFATYDDATEYVEDQRAEDFEYGESDCYEYEIIDLNKQGGNEQ